MILTADYADEADTRCDGVGFIRVIGVIRGLVFLQGRGGLPVPRGAMRWRLC